MSKQQIQLSINGTTRKRAFFLVYIVLCIITPIGCINRQVKAESIESKVAIPKDDVEFRKNGAIVLQAYTNTLTNLSSSNSSEPLVQEIYRQQGYAFIWLNKNGVSPKGKELLQFIDKVDFLGLNKELYPFERLLRMEDSINKVLPKVDFVLFKQLELMLTHTFLQIALHIDAGMYNEQHNAINEDYTPLAVNHKELLSTLATKPIAMLFSSLEPNHQQYRRYMAQLRKFVATNAISANTIHIRSIKEDSLGAIDDIRTALVYHHYLSASVTKEEKAYINALKKFQSDNNLNPDGQIGKNTVKALERNNARKFQLLVINADRWRSDAIDKFPERYLWLNLPSFRLRLIDHDTLRLEKRVVIGKPKTPTPILESAINQIILWPTWTVPQSIIKKEMKSFVGYDVFYRDGRMMVVQPPGLKNALGVVKLVFPNRFSVYIHDTPTKSLFNIDVRAASHGCVRCQDALEVAAQLIQVDSSGITYDSLVVLKDEKIATRVMRLKKPMPVYFRYFTAEADMKNNLIFYEDLYKKDEKMLSIIFKKALNK